MMYLGEGGRGKWVCKWFTGQCRFVPPLTQRLVNCYSHPPAASETHSWHIWRRPPPPLTKRRGFAAHRSPWDREEVSFKNTICEKNTQSSGSLPPQPRG